MRSTKRSARPQPNSRLLKEPAASPGSTFDCRSTTGRVTELDLPDPLLAPLRTDWTRALSRHEPFPSTPTGIAGVELGARIEEIAIVPGSLRLAAVRDGGVDEPTLERALLEHQLADLSDCEAGRDSPRKPVRQQLPIVDVTVQFAPSGAVAQIDPLPVSFVFAACLDRHLRALRLPGADAAHTYVLALTIASGPPRMSLFVAHDAPSRRETRQLLRTQDRVFKACFDDGLKRNDRLAGRMTARLIIDDTGAVVLATASDSTLDDDAVEGCTLRAIRALQLPRASKGHFNDVTYRILFRMEPLPGLESNAAAVTMFATHWVTISSEHFVVYSQGGLAVAQRSIEEAERSYAALRAALALHFDTRRDAGRVTLVVISSTDLYRQLAPLNTGGIYRPARSFADADVVLVRGAGEFRTLQHELVHRLMRPVLPSAPPWLREGLAKYYEWTEVDDDAITVGINSTHRMARRGIEDSPFFDPISKLTLRSQTEFIGPQMLGFYNSAFWLTTTLISNPRYRDRLNGYMRSLSTERTSAAAWKKSFGDVDPQQLERDYLAEPARLEPITYQVDWRPPAIVLSVPRALDDAAGHTFMASLYGVSKPGDARRELDKALQLDPLQAEAFARRALLPSADRLDAMADAERAIAIDPSLPIGWVALGLNLLWIGDHERVDEATRQLLAFRESADAQCVAAMLLASQGKRDAALEAARAAERLAPHFLLIQVTLARLAASAGRTAEAEAAVARVYALAEGTDAKTLDALLGRTANARARDGGW